MNEQELKRVGELKNIISDLRESTWSLQLLLTAQQKLIIEFSSKFQEGYGKDALEGALTGRLHVSYLNWGNVYFGETVTKFISYGNNIVELQKQVAKLQQAEKELEKFGLTVIKK